MKKLSFLLIAIGLFLSSKSSAQIEYHHGLGVGVYTNVQAGAPGLIYNARLNLLELSDNASLSVGSHVGLGLSLDVNSQTGGSGYFVFDLPLTANINIGWPATHYSDGTVGGFAGAGFGFSMIGASDTYTNVSGIAIGPIVEGGIRAYILDQYKVGLRGSYLLAVGSNQASVFSLGFLWYLGDY